MPCDHGCDPCFCRLFPRVSTNIDQCGYARNNLKSEFYNEMSSLLSNGCTIEQVKSSARDFFRKHKCEGPEIAGEARPEYIGHLCKWSRLRRRITTGEVKYPAGSDADDELDKIEKGLEGGLLLEAAELREFLNKIRRLPIGEPIIWVFFECRGVEFPLLFREETWRYVRETLVCRLGLAPAAYLPLRIKLRNDMRIHEATAFDGSFQERWMPGGRTQPDAECEGEVGLREAVMPCENTKGPTFADAEVPALR